MEKSSCVSTFHYLPCALTFDPKVRRVHTNGSYVFLQLWALGRAAGPSVLKQEGGYDFVAASPTPHRKRFPSEDGQLVVPRELTAAELGEYIQLYSRAATNAIDAGLTA